MLDSHDQWLAKLSQSRAEAFGEMQAQVKLMQERIAEGVEGSERVFHVRPAAPTDRRPRHRITTATTTTTSPPEQQLDELSDLIDAETSKWRDRMAVDAARGGTPAAEAT